MADCGQQRRHGLDGPEVAPERRLAQEAVDGLRHVGRVHAVVVRVGRVVALREGVDASGFPGVPGKIYIRIRYSPFDR